MIFQIIVVGHLTEKIIVLIFRNINQGDIRYSCIYLDLITGTFGARSHTHDTMSNMVFILK